MAASLSGPPAARSDPMDEFKLIDDDTPAAPAAGAPAAATSMAAAAPPGAAPAQRPAAPPAEKRGPTPPKVAGSRSLPPPPGKPRARPPAKVAARDQRGPQTLEETLEILGAGQLEIDNGTGETLNESGVRHLRVEVQKNSPFARLLERLSEKMKKS